MASNPELERMIDNLEKAIGNVRFQINMLPSICSGSKEDLDPDTGLRKDFLQLKTRQSKLIEVSSKLQLQHCDNYQKERK